jgi:hypothetical protein
VRLEIVEAHLDHLNELVGIGLRVRELAAVGGDEAMGDARRVGAMELEPR